MASSSVYSDISRYSPLAVNVVDLLTPADTKNTNASNFCVNQYATLQDLMRQASILYENFRTKLYSYRKAANSLSAINTATSSLVLTRIDAAQSTADAMMIEIKKVLDPAKPYYIKMVYTTVLSLDFATATSAFKEFETNLKLIETAAAKLKKEAQPATKETVVSDNTDNKDNMKLDNTLLSKIVYDMEIYIILPGNTKINMQQYMSDLLYTRDFDENAMPIYSGVFRVPQNILKQLKDNFEAVRWFFIIRKKMKAERTTANEFIVPQTIVDNVEYSAIDPQYYPPQDTSGTLQGSLPMYPIKIDFVSKKDIQLNSKVNARVYNNVSVLDVITILCEDVKKDYAKKETDSKNSVKFTIAPPDNNSKYEQIIVEPGSFTDTIYKLQEKYGIYQSGVRVSFDSNHITKKANTTEIGYESYITIIEKGNTAPSADTINNCIIEVVDPNYMKGPVYDSGFNVSKTTSTILIRTYLNYLINRNNSEKLANGESIRVQKSSQGDHVISACDSALSDTNTSKIYWNRYDNPFALTQLQDSIKEKNLAVNIEVRDVDILSLTDNINYSLKFYSKDDTGYSGRYRIKKIAFYFKGGSSPDKDNIESSAVIQFYNLVDLRVNGSSVSRKTYSEKIAEGTTNNASSDKTIIVENSNLSASSNTATNYSQSPFLCNFYGKQDYYGQTIPKFITDDYKMSETVTLRDVYDCIDGVDLGKVAVLCTNFEYFINIQRFSHDVLDVLNRSIGKSKLKSFFRYNIKDNSMGSNYHMLGLAADMVFGKSGDDLSILFCEIAQSALVFDQMILEGNGNSWQYIHISKLMNGTNRKELKVGPDSTAGYYKNVKPGKVVDNTCLTWKDNKWRQSVY